jgi:hypothetical protein
MRTMSLQNWSKKFGVYIDQLKKAVKVVSTCAKEVEKHLRK